MKLTETMVYRTAEIIIDRAAGKMSEDEDEAVREIIKAAYNRGVMDMADQIVEETKACQEIGADWHDLRKNHEDVPGKDVERYLAMCEGRRVLAWKELKHGSDL